MCADVRYGLRIINGAGSFSFATREIPLKDRPLAVVRADTDAESPSQIMALLLSAKSGVEHEMTPLSLALATT